VRATLVGDGDERARLEATAVELGLEDAVRFAGAVGQDRIRDFYRRADIFCLPSFAEGIPRVLMEAMAMGVPVVATHVMGVPELVNHGRSGLVVAPGRADLLADALMQLARDPELRTRLGAEGRRRVESSYDIRDTASALHAVLMKVIAGDEIT
jgi:glycosyltransferase involved in cell wall biosynthesis